MAAAEYYSGASMSSASHLAPPQQGQHHPQQSSGGLPYPESDAPPPYTAYAEPRPHSQPAPQQRPAQPSSSHPPQVSHPQYAPEKNGYPSTPQIQNMYRPQDFNPNYHPQQPQYSQGLMPQQGSSALQAVYNNNQRPSSAAPTYNRPQRSSYEKSRSRSRSRSRNRNRSRSRSRHRRHRHDRPQVQHKKSSGVKTFLGAGGGAIIGDAIFPGLGTLGGAILGGIGGHEYGKHRSHSHSRQTRERSYSNNDGGYYEESRRGRRN